jgi:type IV pilus assembly protein PilY1
MIRVLRCFLVVAGVCVFSLSSSMAGTDEFLGDSSIYSGVPTTVSRPNVLIIIDNSQSTLQTAAGQKYDPTHLYADGEYDPWTVYHGDQQGQIEVKWDVMANSDANLDSIDCRDNSDVVRKTLKLRGTYTGAGDTFYPNIDANSPYDCDSGAQNGEVYALGNYMNYLTSGYVPSTEVDEDLPAECQDPLPIVEITDMVTRTICTNYLPNGNCKNGYLESQTDTITSYYRLLGANDSTHDALDPDNKPGTTGGASFWDGPLSPGINYDYTVWTAGETYQNPLDLQDGDGLYYCRPVEPETLPEPSTLRTQREIMFSALEAASGAALGKVNFGAMIYSQTGQKGGELVFGIQDLSENGSAVAPICQDPATGALINDAKPYCQFLAALPGPDRDGIAGMDGPAPLTSMTSRPQAETLFDAGVYFGAIPLANNITNATVIPEADKNECNLNHIILLTNGFSNKDSDTAIAGLIGDEDLDHYPDENQYGLGSHWLDDIARYLKAGDLDITTHTVLAFQGEDALVKNAAEDGGGEFFNVWNEEQLAAALLDILANIINDSSTSFVAPVVPASTTNRTISSNKVYLGLFRPQENEPWRGNIKKYGLDSTTFELTGYDGVGSNYADGEFKPDSISYWSLNADSKIPTGALKDADHIDPDADTGPTGDGGQVDAGGAGGVLVEKVRALAAAITTENTWEPSAASWRNIYTYTGTSSSLTDDSNSFLPGTSLLATSGNNAITAAMLDVTNEDEKNALIRFMHGLNYDDLHVLSQTKARKWVLGDVLHSRPVVFNYTKYPDLVDNVCPTGGGTTDITAANTWNSSVVFSGANDGMMHAFRDCDGSELWSFIPPNVLPDLQYVKSPDSVHASLVDSASSVLIYDQNENGTIDQGTDRVVLLFGQRRGGGTDDLDTTSSRGAYTALDVSDPYEPVLLWQFDNANLSEMGETWSQPRLAKVKTGANSFKVVMFAGIGYDNNEDFRFGNTQTFPDSTDLNLNIDATAGGEVDGADGALVSSGAVAAEARNAPRGRGLVAIEVGNYARATSADSFLPSLTGGTVGTTYWSYTNAAATSTDQYNADLKYSFASDLTVIDFDSNGYADTIYTGDTGGNLWRFDLSNISKTNWSGEILFTANPGADSTNGRKIFYKPAVVNIGAPHIYFGTGDREHPLNLSTVDRLYCVIDWKKIELANGITPSYPLTEGDLEDMTTNPIQSITTTAADAEDWRKRLYSSPLAPYNPFSVTDVPYTNGWYVKLDGFDRDAVDGDPGEKMLAPATVFNGEVFFSTYQIDLSPRAGCDAGNLGVSRLYHLDYKTGEAVMNYDASNDSSTLPDNERAIGATKEDGSSEILQRTDRVRTLGEGIPSGIVTLIDASGNVTQLISSSDKVESSQMTDVKLITPVYWMQW